MRRALTWVAMIAVAVLGVAAFVYGGADDSPGLQGIGLLIVIASLVSIVRSERRSD